MWLRALICVIVTAAIFPRGMAAPFLPASDHQVVERLPITPSDPVIRDLRALHSRLTLEPDDLPLALRLAQGYLELGRVTGDPRYAGYAEAALAPWWRLREAPPEVLVLRAVL